MNTENNSDLQYKEYRCSLCPRRCNARRAPEGGEGFCGMGSMPVAARAMIHKWEEPCISGSRGTGAVFFSGCVLRCAFCQNYEVSAHGFGKRLTVRELREVCDRLIGQGVHTLDFVTPTQFIPALRELLKEPFPVPAVYNTGGYERVESLKSLEGKIDVYLPDLKYGDDRMAERYSAAPDYFERATEAIREMVRQVGRPRFNSEGILEKGVLIRHLVLPGGVANSRKVIEWVADTFAPGEVLFSVMGQYLPFGRVSEGEFPELNRRVERGEYRRVEKLLMQSGIEDGYMQELTAAEEKYIPAFDLEGL